MRKIVLFLFLISSCNMYATYPVIDFKGIMESIKQLQEATKQTSIMGEQTSLMVEELSVAWSTYDNAVNMYDTLGNYDKMLKKVKGLKAFKDLASMEREYGRITKNLGDGLDVRDIGAISKSSKRIFRTTENYEGRVEKDIKGIEKKIDKEGKAVMRSNYIASLVRDKSVDPEDQDAVDDAVARMTNDEKAQSMLENSYVSMAETITEVEQVRNFNAEVRKINVEAASETPTDLLTATEQTRLAVMMNTEASIENMDMQTDLMIEQNRLLLEGNEMLNNLNPEREQTVNAILDSSRGY